MFIRRLSANKDTFHTVEFKPNNLNVILGSKSDDENNKSSSGETVNGVGKSLTVKLIDYCLGSTQNAHKIIKKLKEQDWEFELIIEDNHRKYIINREVNKGKITLNEKIITLGKFNDILEAEFFYKAEDYKYISFRSLISRYLRIPKLAYTKWEQYKSKEEEDKSVLYNAFLLGLDPELIIKKIDNKTKINEIDSSKKYLKKDQAIKNVLSGSNVSIGIATLNKEILELENKLATFKISEGYNDIKLSIEEGKLKKNNIINQITKCENTINTINNNLKKNVDVTYKRVAEIYEEAEVLFSTEMLKSLEEISNFHEQLLEGRKARLIKDKKLYIKKADELKKNLTLLDEKINNDMAFIKDKVSTSEYERLQQRLTELKIQLNKAQQYEKVLKEFEQSIAKVNADMAQDNLKAIEYLQSIEDYKKGLSLQFQEYVDYIYEESRVCGIDIENNSGNNKIRYNIIPEIQGDESDGVGNVKLFCMDLLIWQRKVNNSVEFLYHDGFLFTDIDPRQIYRMLKLAYTICLEDGLQYIFNINYNMFDSIINVAKENDDEEFINYLDSSVRLKLYDDSPENKLLGIEV